MLIGFLGADPEMRSTGNGQVANLRIATEESWKDKDTGEKKERTEWHRVVFFGRTAEVCGEYLRKGSQVYIEGRLQTKKWKDADGNDRYTTEIIGHEMQMLNSKKDGSRPNPDPDVDRGAKEAPPKERIDESFDDEIPF